MDPEDDPRYTDLEVGSDYWKVSVRLLMSIDCDVCFYFVRSLLIIRVKDHFKNNVGSSDHFRVNVFSVVSDLLSFNTENPFYSFHNRYFLLNIFT